MADAPRAPGLPAVIAHRTCPHHAPENSLEGIRRAAELGADAVEIDVRLTRDAQPILLHDRTFRRTTGKLAPPWALSLRDVRDLRLANGEPVPTFAAALDALPEGLRMAIHVKVSRAVHPVLDEIRNQGAESRVWIWSKHPSVVRFSVDRHPEIEASLLRDTRTSLGRAAYFRAALRCGAHGMSAAWKAVTPDFAAQVHRAGVRLYSWCRTKAVPADTLAVLDGVVTDWPDTVRSLLGGRASG